MNLVADEGVDRAIVERLRQEGHEVSYVAEMSPGISDETVLSLAGEHGALLITTDKDFGELVFRQRRASAGVLLLRLHGLSLRGKASLTAEALAAYGDEMRDSFTVLSPSAVRTRPHHGRG